MTGIMTTLEKLLKLKQELSDKCNELKPGHDDLISKRNAITRSINPLKEAKYLFEKLIEGYKEKLERMRESKDVIIHRLEYRAKLLGNDNPKLYNKDVLAMDEEIGNMQNLIDLYEKKIGEIDQTELERNKQKQIEADNLTEQIRQISFIILPLQYDKHKIIYDNDDIPNLIKDCSDHYFNKNVSDDDRMELAAELMEYYMSYATEHQLKWDTKNIHDLIKVCNNKYFTSY